MTDAAPLSCKDVVDLVTEYLEGAMRPERRLAFEEHVAICPPCRNYFDQLRRTIALGSQIHEDDVPPDVRDALVEVFRDWRTEAR
jgi:predicted anti-sigma-YlaC factor YlaD